MCPWLSHRSMSLIVHTHMLTSHQTPQWAVCCPDSQLVGYTNNRTLELIILHTNLRTALCIIQDSWGSSRTSHSVCLSLNCSLATYIIQNHVTPQPLPSPWSVLFSEKFFHKHPATKRPPATSHHGVKSPSISTGFLHFSLKNDCLEEHIAPN